MSIILDVGAVLSSVYLKAIKGTERQIAYLSHTNPQCKNKYLWLVQSGKL